ncbi:MAG: hypothetical protein ACW98Y_11130 [Candidatus Thorarchaeota archaeon]|jgi:hypothetical protein
MNRESQKTDNQGKKLKAVLGIMALVALFAPAHAQVSEWGSSIIAMTWQWSIYTYDSWFMFDPIFMLISSLPFTFLRPVFIVMFNRLYKEKTTKRRVLLVGIISEIFVEAIYYGMMIIQLIVYPWGMFGIPLIFPVPLLFGLGLVYMKLVPPPEVSSWVEETEPNHWWTQKEGETEPEGTEADKKKSDIWMDEPASESDMEPDAHN